MNTCLGWLRHEKRRAQMLQRAQQEPTVVATNPRPDVTAIRNDDLEQLYARIERLAPVDRLLVSLYLEDLHSAEIAEVLGISVGIVLAAAYLSFRGRWFGRVDYMAPARDFLASAGDRYRFWKPQDAMFIIPLSLILELAGGLVVWQTALKYLSDRGTLLTLVGYGVFLIALNAFAWGVSWRNWKQENAALLAEIRRRQRDLENG